MVTLELKNYIQEQIKASTSREDIRKALLEAGWPEIDINEAMKGFEPAATPVMTISKAGTKEAPKTPVVQGNQPSQPKPAFITSDIFQSKNEPMFQPKAQTMMQQPSIARIEAEKKPVVAAAKAKKFILPIFLGLVIIVLLVAIGFLYRQNSDLNSKVTSGESKISSLTQTTNSLNSEKDGLNNRIALLNGTVSDLNNQMTILVVPANVSSTAELFTDLKGTLNFSKGVYGLITSKGIIVYFKNSKDIQAAGTLKDLTGKEVQISGTHLPGSNYFTLTKVNDIFIYAASSTAK